MPPEIPKRECAIEFGLGVLTAVIESKIEGYSPIDALAAAGFPLVLQVGGVVVILGVYAH